MECSKGSIVKELEHEVKTLEKAREWWPDCDGTPITIRQLKAGNGRLRIEVYRDGKQVYVRG